MKLNEIIFLSIDIQFLQPVLGISTRSTRSPDLVSPSSKGRFQKSSTWSAENWNSYQQCLMTIVVVAKILSEREIQARPLGECLSFESTHRALRTK